MRPALYVDVDVDQYTPTSQSLDWMFSEGIIRPGTYVGYDDIGSTAKWSAGESRAHLEMARKYGVHFKLLWNPCRRVRSTDPLRQPGNDTLCHKLSGCRFYYQLIFRVERIDRTTEGALC